MSVRLELRAKNAILHRVVTADGLTVASFCRRHGIPQNRQATIGAWLHLKTSPYRQRDGRPCRLAQQVAAIGQMGVAELFPLDLYQHPVAGPVVGEVSVERFLALSAAPPQIGAPTQEAEIWQRDLRQLLDTAMERLPAQQRAVLLRRYGLNGAEEATYEEIGHALGVGAERARQIHIAALRKLRHPSKSKYLRHALDGRA